MSNKFLLQDWDCKEQATIFRKSHRWVITKTGAPLLDYENDDEQGEPFQGPLICELDDEDCTGVLPVFFTSPALIATKTFYRDLVEIGIDNIEVHSVIINDTANNSTIDNYVLLNILGRVTCASMPKAGYQRINDSADPNDPYDCMNIIDDLVIYASKVGDLELFLVHEDTDCILLSERVYKHLQVKGYTDIWFDEVAQIS